MTLLAEAGRGDVTLVRITPTGRGHEAERVVPPGAACALIGWPGAEGPPPEKSAEAILRALLRAGRLAFRCGDDADSLDGDASYKRAPRLGCSGWLRTTLLPRDADFVSAVVTTASLAVSRRIFEGAGWTRATQAVIAFDPAADPAPIIAALRRGLDWRQRPLPEGARLLFAPGYEGEIAVVAAVNATRLEMFAADLRALTTS